LLLKFVKFVGIYFVSEDQITPPPTVVVGEVVAEGSASLLFRNELYNGRCEVVFPVGEKWRCF
jgi:hypothetical protein